MVGVTEVLALRSSLSRDFSQRSVDPPGRVSRGPRCRSGNARARERSLLAAIVTESASLSNTRHATKFHAPIGNDIRVISQNYGKTKLSQRANHQQTYGQFV
jgi:hypothetical protein